MTHVELAQNSSHEEVQESIAEITLNKSNSNFATQLWNNICHRSASSILSRKSEADASEFQENLGKMFDILA